MTTITATNEQQVVQAVPKQLLIGGAWREGSAGTLAVEDPSTGETLTEIADGTADDARAALDAAVDAADAWASHPPRERGEILRRAFEAIIERAEDLALLMTLEMGKPLARVSRRGALRGRFLPLVRRGGGSHRRTLRGRAQRQGAVADDAPAGRAVLADHAVELPAGDGHPQDRPGNCRGLHDGRQACQADTAVDAGIGQNPRAGRPARRRAEPHHHELARVR